MISIKLQFPAHLQLEEKEYKMNPYERWDFNKFVIQRKMMIFGLFLTSKIARNTGYICLEKGCKGTIKVLNISVL